ncbi:S16 family serine protease [Nocardioides dubius]|uniref:PDZ domain-containing protein n=1 Tax=Nocardioides dubius TaxID=317019 RepID=A0ABP4EK48_9ACTN
MSRRSLATVIAVPLMVGLWLAAALVPVPYVTSRPGLTVDVLAETQGQEIIQIEGHRTYYDGGELRMTTVASDGAEDNVSLFSALRAWLSDDQAVQPFDSVYRRGETNQQNREEAHQDMVTSQDVAVAVALKELGYEIPLGVKVSGVPEGSPSAGKLEVNDELVQVGDTKVTDADALLATVKEAEAGEPLPIVVKRDGKRVRVEVTPETVTDDDGSERVALGINIGTGFVFPFDVQVNINPAIGGPSAGLVFALAIYDTLTEGSLTGGRNIAGTGALDVDGAVEPIGGIQQKIAGARDSGSELFLVPAANCAEAVGADNGDMRLTRVATFEDAKEAIEAFAEDRDAKLPTCSGDDGK